MGAIGAPLDLLGENLLYGFHRLDAVLITIFARKGLGLLSRGYSAIEIVFSVTASMNNTTVLGMDILLRLGDDPCLGHLGLASNRFTCLAGDLRSPHL